MTAASTEGTEGDAARADEIAAALRGALTAGTRDAFTALLTSDVHWGSEHGGNECTTVDQAGDHYSGLLAAGVRLSLTELHAARHATTGAQYVARIRIEAPDPEDFPSQLTVRLTLRDGLIGDIRELDPPPTIEVLYFDGCPSYERFLPHLTSLLDEHDIDAPVTLVLVEDDDSAQALSFVGSPTVRINGLDVEPAIAERQLFNQLMPSEPSPYGLQCRLYQNADETIGDAPRDEWIVDALVDNPIQVAAIAAIQSGDIGALEQLLDQIPGLASTRLRRRQGRTLLHIATDWPGHYPNVAATIGALVRAGADPDVPALGDHAETPLHWAASSNDIDAIDALVANGANINARGAVIANGTPMADATAFGQWDAARRLVEHGADTNLFEASTLGLVAEVERHLSESAPTSDDITSSFWGACHGGHVTTAALLLDHGADINWIGYDDLTPLGAARRSEASDVVAWLTERGASST